MVNKKKKHEYIGKNPEAVPFNNFYFQHFLVVPHISNMLLKIKFSNCKNITHLENL